MSKAITSVHVHPGPTRDLDRTEGARVAAEHACSVRYGLLVTVLGDVAKAEIACRLADDGMPYDQAIEAARRLA